VWGEGDGSTHKVYDTEIGRLGGLICGEHTMQLPGFTLAAMGEKVHIGSWIGLGFVNPLSEICSRHYAIACNTFVICSQSVVGEPIIKKSMAEIETAGTWSTIIEAGTGRIMAGPLVPGEGASFQRKRSP
jgi:nitrilase